MCAELLPLLTPEQLDFEVRYSNDVLCRDLDFKTDMDFVNSKAVKLNALQNSVNISLGHEFNEIFDGCESFSYLTHELSRLITEAQQFIDDLKRPVVATEISHDTEEPRPESSKCNLQKPVCLMDYNVADGLTVENFTNSIDFRSLSKRRVAHFGPSKYHYSGITQDSAEYPTCEALDTVMSRIREHTGDQSFNKENLCCTVTHYPDSSSHIPMHSDDEESIVPGSCIVTVSIGASRIVTFQNIIGPLQPCRSLTLEHGSVHLMTHASQFEWEHGILPSPDHDQECRPRILLTFRKLQAQERPKIPPICRPDPKQDTNVSVQHRKPKRVLLLSDSIHISFPTHLFDPKNAVCIKKRLPNFCLSDIHNFEDEFSYTDYVFLSCGVNDLSRYKWSARNLKNYFTELMTKYAKKFPNTTFIFNSVLLTDFTWLNREIDALNIDIFKASLLDDANFWYFDSHHIAKESSRKGMRVIERGSRRANGVHITYDVTNAIQTDIRHCLEFLCCGSEADATKSWPLRDQFRNLLARAP